MLRCQLYLVILLVVIIIVLTIVVIVIIIVVLFLVVIVHVVLLSVLCCEFGLHLVDCSAFEFLAHGFLFLLPVELPLVRRALACVVVGLAWRGNVRVQRVVQLVELHLVLRDLAVFLVNLQVLVFGKLVVLGEVAHRLTQTDLVVERRGLDDDDRRRRGGALRLAGISLSLRVDLTVLDGDFVEELVGGVLKDDELVTDDAADDFALLFGVHLVAVFRFVHLLHAAARASSFAVQHFVDVDRLRAALEFVRRAKRTV